MSINCCDTLEHITVIAKCADALLVRRQIGRWSYQWGYVVAGELTWKDSEYEARQEFFTLARAKFKREAA